MRHDRQRPLQPSILCREQQRIHLGRRLLVAFLLALIGTVGQAGPAGAQDTDGSESSTTTEGLGTADFRTAPILGPGTYEDLIVTGSTIWYAVLYTNDQPYRFEADLLDTDLEAEPGLDLVIDFVGPTLDPLGSGQLLEGSAQYTGGGTNLWYLAIQLKTEGRVGVEHELVLDIDGVGTGRLDRCEDLDDCTLDEDLKMLDAELVDVQAQLDELPGADAEQVLGAEIDALEERRGEAGSSLDEATTAIAALCAPADDCNQVSDPGSTTPLWALLAGGAVLTAGLGALAIAVISRARLG